LLKTETQVFLVLPLRLLAVVPAHTAKTAKAALAVLVAVVAVRLVALPWAVVVRKDRARMVGRALIPRATTLVLVVVEVQVQLVGLVTTLRLATVVTVSLLQLLAHR
jgi:hypothetical protein